MRISTFLLNILAVTTFLSSLAGAATPPPPVKAHPPPPLRVLPHAPPPLSSSLPPPRKGGPPPPSRSAPPPPVLTRSPPPHHASPPPPAAPTMLHMPPPPQAKAQSGPPPPAAKPAARPPPPKSVGPHPPPPKAPVESPPPPAEMGSGPTTYTKTISPPTGFQFCEDTAAKLNADPGGSVYTNLFGYSAFFPVLYCTADGSPAGTLAIWSNVSFELCAETSFGSVSAQCDATSYTIMIPYNGVGTITTQSQAVPLISSKFTVAGPHWDPSDDGLGDITWTYNGTNDGPYGPVASPFYNGPPCGTPFATIVGDQIGVMAVPQCDTSGNPQGWNIYWVGYQQDYCATYGINDAQVYIDVGLDSDGNPVINGELAAYTF